MTQINVPDTIKVENKDFNFRDLCALFTMHAFVTKNGTSMTTKEIADNSYVLADEMIKRRTR